MPGSRFRSATIVAITVAGASISPAAPAAERIPDPMRIAARCEEGSAVRTGALGVRVVVGVCEPNEAVPAGSPSPPSPDAPAGPADCLVPGLDDRCEAWAAPRYDGGWPNSDDYPGFGSTDRHTTMVAHPSKDLLFLGGTSTYPNGGLYDADFVQIAYRASTGQPLWTSVFPGLGELTLAYETSIGLSPDGETLYAVGIAAEPGVYRYHPLIVAFATSDGRLRWVREAPINVDTLETAITELPDGTERETIYLVGTGSGLSPSGELVSAGAVAALDPADGSPLWVSTDAGETEYGARFNELVVSPDGSAVYAGGGEHLPDLLATNFFTVGFRAVDGVELWEARDTRTQPTTGTNGITDMAITPDGSRVLITGFDTIRSSSLIGDSSSAILTIAYETGNGDVAWRKTYDGPVEGEVHYYFNLFQGMMDISPDGRTAVVTAAINSHNSTGTAAYDVVTGAEKWGVESVEQGYVFTNYIGFYPQVQATNTGAFISNRRGVGLSRYQTVTTAYGLSDGTLGWTARFGTNRALFGGNALAPDGKRLFVAASDDTVGSVGFPVPDPNLDTRDIVTFAYDL